MALGREMTATSPPVAGGTPHESQLRREQQLARRRRIIELVQGQGLLFVFIVVFVIMWASSPYFFTINNLATAAGVVSVLGVMAVAETLVIIGGEIDVSIGSVMALSSVLIGNLVGYGLNPWVASLIAACAAATVGLLNGVLVVFFRINSLVVTLGMYSITLGIAYMLSDSSTVIVGGSGFEQIGSGNIWKLPIQFYVFLGIWALGYLVLRGTALGRHIYALGNNYDAAVRAGIRADMLRIGLFITIALSACLAGIIVTSELSSAAPQVGDPYLLAVVTAAILGGASLSGGRGTLVGTLIAVGILGILQNGFALLSLSVYTQYMVIGVLLILAVLTDQLAQRAER
jgi:ribose transport system permease protein